MPAQERRSRQIPAALLLLDDDDRTAQLAEALDDVRRTVGTDHEKFLAWVARRGDGESH